MWLNVNATNKYVSSSGNDNNDGSIDNPYKTLAKVNMIFSTLNAGDSILFKRGEIFYGTLTINKSGTVSNPIVIGAYGTGTKPIFTGLQNMSNWVNVSNGIYESFNSTLNGSLNVVTLNDELQGMGRYPNANDVNGGFLNFESHSANVSITDLQLNTPNYTGAELVVRTNRYIIDRTKITKQVTTTLTYSPALSYEPANGFGYFIQNDIRTLDQLGEWFYNTTTKKLSMYFGANNPAAYSVKASAINNVINVSNFDNIVFDNLKVIGGNNYSIYLYSTNNVVVQNCDVDYSGIDGIEINSPTNFKGINNTVNRSNNIGINLNASSGSLLSDNIVTNTALIKGLGQNNANKSLGIRETGHNDLIQYNSIGNSGYMGIRFGGDNTIVQYNFVDQFNLNKDDGGGIYTSDDGVGRKIIGNIIMNGIGAALGTNNPIANSTSGIYIDDFADNIIINGNTVASCNKSGLFLHNAHDLSINGNTLFNNASQQLLMSHNLTRSTASPLRNIGFKNNILFSKNTDQSIIQILTVKNDVSLSAGSMDSNYYCRPLDDNFIIKTQYVDATGKTLLQDLDLALWQNTYSKDINTRKTASSILSYNLNSVVGGNKFANGTFNVSVVGTSFGSTGIATRSWNANKLDGGTLQIGVASPKPCMSTITIPILGVSTTKKYLITFTAQCSKDTMLYVYARQTSSPYKVLSNNGTKTIVNLENTRHDYAVAFQPTLNNAMTSIFFESPVQNATWWLDNIQIVEADETITNPDDSIRFEYNASKDTQSIVLHGLYQDAAGTIYNNNIKLPPYTSSILIRKGDEIIVPVDTAIYVSLVNNDKDTMDVGSTIHLTAKASAYYGIRKVEFFNGIYLIYTSWAYPYNFAWTNVQKGNFTLTTRVQDKHLNLIRSAPIVVSVIKTQ